MADFTIFLQSDPMDHLHFDFLDLVLRSSDVLGVQEGDDPRLIQCLVIQWFVM